MAKKPISRKVKKKPELKRSALEIFDIPLELIDPSPENPQEMDEATFDELVDGIRSEGMDEPIHVIRMYDEAGEHTGRYMLTSGHHRHKACKVIGLAEIPAVIKADMDDAARKVALVRRNQLRGSMNSKKFTRLFQEVAPLLGEATAKRLMGFTKEAAFKRVFEQVTNSLPKDARKQMEDAKETVTSVDDLSAIVNDIFRREGSKPRSNFMIFNFGGKKNFYFKADKALTALLEKLPAELEKTGQDATEWFTSLMQQRIEGGVAPAKRKKVKRG